jgi:hypothetical protein
VRGDVLQARIQKRIAVRPVPVMAHERALRALSVIKLAPRKAVIDEKRRAAREHRANGARESQRRFVRLAQVFDERLVVDFIDCGIDFGQQRVVQSASNGLSSNAKPLFVHDTPRSCHTPSLRTARRTGIASSTSLPITTPSKCSGSALSQRHLRCQFGRIGFNRRPLAFAAIRPTNPRLRIDRRERPALSARSAAGGEFARPGAKFHQIARAAVA